MLKIRRTTSMSSALARTITLSLLGIVAMGCARSGDRALAHYEALPAGAYAIVAEVRAKPGKADALRAATLPLVVDVRREPNNLLYFLHEDREVPGRFVFYEIFASKADFEAHNATPHVQAWFAKLPELADGEVTVERLELLGN
jgi:quinol monooxygenase YgiN